MSGETNYFSIPNEVTLSDDSFLRGMSEDSVTTSTKDIQISEPSDTSTTVSLYSANLKPQCSSTPEQPTSDIYFQSTTVLPVTAWPMFLEKYLEQAQEISKRLQLPPFSNVYDHSAVESSLKMQTETMVSSSSKTPSETKWLSENEFIIHKIKPEVKMKDPSTWTKKRSSSKKIDVEKNSVGQSEIFIRRHERKSTITSLQKNKLALPEDAESALSVKVNSVATAPSLNSANYLPKKRHCSLSSPSEGEVFQKNENMVVSVLNATSNNLLSKQGLKSSLEWHSPPHNSTSETDQPTCLLNFDACDQRRRSPVQNDEENSCYGSEVGGENLSPPQENSRSSTSEEMGASLFPITGFGSTSNCAEYLNSDEKDSLQSSPPYFQDDDMYQTTTRGCNNNNKPKVHKCRSCGFTTTNKHESWEHIAQHMKPEKILRCTKCPFVTEYKHHLDFHMWNHEGKKPFKCDKCSYECVNKSMLKSHSKSHSSVYPFQCESCGYKTKYCHSMKIHLRRHKHHQPKAVLDDEGNPDPALFIDINSNRRGPKQKNRKSGDAQLRQQQRRQQQHLQLQLQQEQQLGPPAHLQNPPPPPFTHPPPLATLALGQFTNYSAWPEKVFPETAPMGYPMLPHPMESDNEEMFMPDTCVEEKPTLTAPFYLSPYEPLPLTIPPLPPGRLIEPKEEPEEAPLNLCPQTVEAPLNLSLSHNSSHTTESNPGSSGSSSCSASGSTPAVKNRRKGVACKLKRISYPETSAEDGPAPVAQSTSSSTSGDIASLDHSLENAVTESQSEAENEVAAGLRNKSNYYCEYCEITFHNQIMFTLHKGCHGFSDPFTCNRCGTKTDNKIDFYSHMILEAHK